MYFMNSNGPKIDPWGTPMSIKPNLDITVSVFFI